MALRRIGNEFTDRTFVPDFQGVIETEDGATVFFDMHGYGRAYPVARRQIGALLRRHSELSAAGIETIVLLHNTAPKVAPVFAEVVQQTLRTMGVLQRIALCFGAAALLVWWLPRRGVAWAAVAGARAVNRR